MEPASPFTVREVRRADLMEWMRLRARLWPELSMEEHRRQMDGVYDNPADFYQVFVADAGPQGLAGLLEASVEEFQRAGSRVKLLLVEGFRVDEEFADASVGADLHRAAERWGREQGCAEIGTVKAADDPVVGDYLKSGYRVQATTVRLLKPLS